MNELIYGLLKRLKIQKFGLRITKESTKERQYAWVNKITGLDRHA
jgi:hypothetical protein